MQCEQCGGDAWDNRQKVANGWKGPLAKCKDADCGWRKWPPKGERSGGGGGNAGKGASGSNGAGSVRSTRPLGPLYFACMQLAAESVKRLVPNATPTDIVAATATLFIGATNTGAPLRTPKPKPAPKPEPVEEEDYAADGEPLSDDLPF